MPSRTDALFVGSSKPVHQGLRVGIAMSVQALTRSYQPERPKVMLRRNLRPLLAQELVGHLKFAQHRRFLADVRLHAGDPAARMT